MTSLHSTRGMTLETERLRLRPTTLKDLAVAHQWYGDPATMQYITGHPCTMEETEQRLRKTIADHAAHGIGLCMTELKETGEPIGHCGLKPFVVDGVLQGELAWMFAPSHWRLGLGTEVARGLIEYARRPLSLPRIIAIAHPHNAHSLTIIERLGMTRVSAADPQVTYELIL